MRKQIMSVIFALIVGIPCSANGMEPLDALKVPVDQLLGILKDPQYQDAAREDAQREEIWETIRQVFDFPVMAKLALARNWKKFTPQQRKEFTDLFAELLESTYVDKIQGGYEEEKVLYLGQKMVSDSKARVTTKILRSSVDIPIVYSMLKRNDIWRVYDVKIEGVSLIKNYRTQFSHVLAKDSPAHLIKRLKRKIELQKKKRTKSRMVGGPY
ncbi:MAG: ABC transporter substrate-binding protein [Candidatus Desulfatibia sp.]|uniref:MlaC/ttg2D family ABC transporter substrate-binding protein n=1 Tax=Candidatus Desulfatibia sp. TaxID=3101189 RepID=UPI002F32C8E7